MLLDFFSIIFICFDDQKKYIIFNIELMRYKEVVNALNLDKNISFSKSYNNT